MPMSLPRAMSPTQVARERCDVPSLYRSSADDDHRYRELLRRHIITVQLCRREILRELDELANRVNDKVAELERVDTDLRRLTSLLTPRTESEAAA